MDIGNPSTEPSIETFSTAERFVILLYDRTSHHVNVNSARQHLFTQKGLQIGNIPPTHDSLILHLKRATYQAAHVWGQCLIATPSLPCPSNWGWKNEDAQWLPVWMTLAEAADCCPELLRCGCKAGCVTRRCKCNRADLKCTALCGCEGECIRE